MNEFLEISCKKALKTHQERKLTRKFSASVSYKKFINEIKYFTLNSIIMKRFFKKLTI